MKKHVSIILAFCVVIGFSAMASAASVFFDFNGDQLQDTSWLLNVGDSLTADIYFSPDQPDAHNGLQTAGVEVQFDITHFDAVSASSNPAFYIPMVGLPDIDNDNGTVGIGAGMLTSVTGDAILIGSVNFQCIAAGTSALSTGQLFPDSPGFDSLVAGDQHVYDSEVIFESADVSSVPIPGAIWLLGTGFLGLAGLRRRRS